MNKVTTVNFETVNLEWLKTHAKKNSRSVSGQLNFIVNQIRNDSKENRSKTTPSDSI